MVTFQLHKWKRPNGQCTFHCGSGTLWIIKIRIMIGPENRGPKTIQDLLGLSNDQIKGWYRIMIVTIWRLISQDIFCFRCADFYSFINRVVEKRPNDGKSQRLTTIYNDFNHGLNLRKNWPFYIAFKLKTKRKIRHIHHIVLG